jgi:hypothetical protein
MKKYVNKQLIMNKSANVKSIPDNKAYIVKNC